MHYTKEDITNMERTSRLLLINSITGIKPANLIGTISEAGISNLAIFSSVVHLGSNPALIGLISRPNGDVPRHTYEHITQQQQFTINHVNSTIITQAHYTSAKFDRDTSEFETCKLTEEYISGFKAPFVKESHLKMGLTLVDVVPIAANNTTLIIGTVEHLLVPENATDEHNKIDLEKTDTVGISGLNTYYELKKTKHLPHARVEELPEF